MDEWKALCDAVRGADAAIATAAAAHDGSLAANSMLGVRRSMVADGWSLDWKGDVLRSLWLVSHRGLRRDGIRKHPTHRVVLLGWRGLGLVQQRAPGARRTFSLVPFQSVPDAESVHWVDIAAGAPYDTMADAATWHVLAAHAHPSADLVREVPAEDGWRTLPEAT